MTLLQEGVKQGFSSRQDRCVINDKTQRFASKFPWEFFDKIIASQHNPTVR
jgi:hypothetical protein